MERHNILLLAGVTALCIGIGLATSHVHGADLPLPTQARWLPDPVRTPGAINPAITQANINQTLCNPHWSTRSERPPVSYTNRLKRQQIVQYGYSDKRLSSYEEDHRIPLEAAGNPTDPKNLWPEILKGQYGAHAKDRLENYVHRQICAGKMTLQQGQAIFFGNWITAYQHYLLHVEAAR